MCCLPKPRMNVFLKPLIGLILLKIIFEDAKETKWFDKAKTLDTK